MSARAYDALIDARDIQRLMDQRDIARSERDRARALAADLEGALSQHGVILAEAINLLRWAITDQPSHAIEEQLGRDIVAFLMEHGKASP